MELVSTDIPGSTPFDGISNKSSFENKKFDSVVSLNISRCLSTSMLLMSQCDAGDEVGEVTENSLLEILLGNSLLIRCTGIYMASESP